MATGISVYTVERQNLAEQVYNNIKRLILSGELKGGENIFEDKIAEQFGISRTPVREAFRRLDEYGLIELKPRKYAVVIALDPHEAEHITRVRAQLETLSVELLTECGMPEDFDVLEELAKECDALLCKPDIPNEFEKDMYFHLEIARRTENRHLYDLLEKIAAKVQLLRLELHLSLEYLKTCVGQHTAIVEAMRQGKKEAALALMKKHIINQLQYYPKEKTS
jgi:DNA-binding GntR family transcriptional regulator